MDIDTTKLESHLTAELGVGAVETEVLQAGLNVTIELSTAGDGPAYVVRWPNKLRDTDLFIDLKREFELMQRLSETPLDVPVPVLFCDDPSIVGEPFFVMTHLDGDTIPLGAALPDRFQRPAARRCLAEELFDTLAEIHSLETVPFEDMCEYQSPEDQVDRAIDRLDEARCVTGDERPTLRAVGDWLLEHAPSDSNTTLVHGDYRPGNVLFAEADRPEITGVLDWETAMLGDPLTEVGYLLLRWGDDDDPTPALDEIEARYSDDDAIGRLKEANERGLAPFTTRPGSPSRRELAARYEERTGRPFENERFYRAHAAFMLAAVWTDLHRHRIETGEPSDWGPHIDYMAAVADIIVRGDHPL